MSVQNDEHIDKFLSERENNWKVKLFTLNHGFNNHNKWYALILIFIWISHYVCGVYGDRDIKMS